MRDIQGQPVLYVGDSTVYLTTPFLNMSKKDDLPWEAVGLTYNPETGKAVNVMVYLYTQGKTAKVWAHSLVTIPSSIKRRK